MENVIVSEPSKERREALVHLGADNLVDPASEDLSVHIGEATGGRGVDAAFDAAGAGAALTGALASLTPRGVLVVVAVHERPAELNPTVLVMSETQMRGSLAYLLSRARLVSRTPHAVEPPAVDPRRRAEQKGVHILTSRIVHTC